MAIKDAPGPDADQSDWVNYAMSHGLPSYEAWVLTPAEIAAKFPPPAPPAKPGTTKPKGS